MDVVALISRWTHVGTAIVLVGGSAFLTFAVLPSLQLLSAEQKTEFLDALRSRWKKFVHGGIALLLVSGFYNYLMAMQVRKGDKLYHILMGNKILLALILMGLVSVLVGRSTRFAALRKEPKRALGIALLLAAAIVMISGYLRTTRWQPYNPTPAVVASPSPGSAADATPEISSPSSSNVPPIDAAAPSSATPEAGKAMDGQ